MLIPTDQVELIQSTVVVNSEKFTLDVIAIMQNNCDKKVVVTAGCIVSLSRVTEEEKNSFINVEEDSLLLERGEIPILYSTEIFAEKERKEFRFGAIRISEEYTHIARPLVGCYIQILSVREQL